QRPLVVLARQARVVRLHVVVEGGLAVLPVLMDLRDVEQQGRRRRQVVRLQKRAERVRVPPLLPRPLRLVQQRPEPRVHALRERRRGRRDAREQSKKRKDYGTFAHATGFLRLHPTARSFPRRPTVAPRSAACPVGMPLPPSVTAPPLRVELSTVKSPSVRLQKVVRHRLELLVPPLAAKLELAAVVLVRLPLELRAHVPVLLE